MKSNELPMVSECNFQGKSFFFMQPINFLKNFVALCKFLNQMISYSLSSWFFLIVGIFKTRMTNCPSFFYVLQHSKPPRQVLICGGGFFHILTTSKTRTMSCTRGLGFFCCNLWNHNEKLQLVIMIFVALCKFFNYDNELQLIVLVFFNANTSKISTSKNNLMQVLSLSS